MEASYEREESALTRIPFLITSRCLRLCLRVDLHAADISSRTSIGSLYQTC
jgi:hypothetical protein